MPLQQTGKFITPPDDVALREDLLEGFATTSASVAFSPGFNSMTQGLIAGAFTLGQDTVDHLVTDYTPGKGFNTDPFMSQLEISIGDAVSATIIGTVAGLGTMTPFTGSRRIAEEAEIAKKMSGGEISEKVVTTVFAEVQYAFSSLIKVIDVQNDARFEPEPAGSESNN